MRKFTSPYWMFSLGVLQTGLNFLFSGYLKVPYLYFALLILLLTFVLSLIRLVALGEGRLGQIPKGNRREAGIVLIGLILAVYPFWIFIPKDLHVW